MLTWHKEGRMRVAPLSHYKASVITRVCNPSAQEMEARGSDSQDHLQVHSVFEASRGILRLCPETKEKSSFSIYQPLFRLTPEVK